MNILIIAYYYPPDSSSGSFRPLFFGRYLKEMGERIFIHTASEKDYLEEQPRDDNLLSDVDLSNKVFRTSVLRHRETLIAIKKKFIKIGIKHKQTNYVA